MTPTPNPGQARHAQERALERYHLRLNPNDLREIALLIQGGCSVPSPDPQHQGTNQRHHHVLRFRNKVICVLYQKRSKTIITVLPLTGKKRWAAVCELDRMAELRRSKEGLR